MTGRLINASEGWMYIPTRDTVTEGDAREPLHLAAAMVVMLKNYFKLWLREIAEP